jgi:hypothetical protein
MSPEEIEKMKKKRILEIKIQSLSEQIKALSEQKSVALLEYAEVTRLKNLKLL